MCLVTSSPRVSLTKPSKGKSSFQLGMPVTPSKLSLAPTKVLGHLHPTLATSKNGKPKKKKRKLHTTRLWSKNLIARIEDLQGRAQQQGTSSSHHPQEDVGSRTRPNHTQKIVFLRLLAELWNSTEKRRAERIGRRWLSREQNFPCRGCCRRHGQCQTRHAPKLRKYVLFVILVDPWNHRTRRWCSCWGRRRTNAQKLKIS